MSTIQKLDAFVAWTDAEVIQEVRQRMAVCAQSLIELAEVVGVACRRGIDLNGVMNPLLLDDLRKIESGQIVPELAERFMHERIYPRLKSLPIDDQKRIAETGKVGVVVRRGDTFDLRMMDVVAMSRDQSMLVFDRGRIRSREEMITILETEEQLPDVIEEVAVRVKINADIGLTKAQQRQLNRLIEKSGSMSALIQQAILKLL